MSYYTAAENDYELYLEHYGVKGMRWGVRKDRDAPKKTSFRDEIHKQTVGQARTSVVTKNGDRLSVIKEKPSRLGAAIGKMTGTKPPDFVSSMRIEDSSGKKVGSFQMWRVDKNTVQGEWLEIKKSEQGKGYSKAALQSLLSQAKKDPEIKRVIAQVPQDAEAAKHIYGSLGFKKTKTLGSTEMFGVIDEWEAKVG